LTATGEIFKNKNLTAACNLFKLNTLVRVTNLRNGTYVIVRINDRMHPNMLKKGRVIDLSQAAAKKLILNTKGIVKVTVEAIGYSKITPKA
jgi:rare lipoprotein A